MSFTSFKYTFLHVNICILNRNMFLKKGKDKNLEFLLTCLLFRGPENKSVISSKTHFR